MTCRGEGHFRWWDDPSAQEEVIDYECPCIDQWVLHRYLLHSGVKRSYQTLCWADMQWVDPKASEFVAAYRENVDGYVNAGYGMILYGTQGTGKTALCVLLLKDLLGMGYGGYFATYNDIVDLFRSGWKSEEDKGAFVRTIKNAQVLVIDDTGKESNPNSMTEALFNEVIRHRVASMKPTLITTNLDMGNFQQKYGDNSMSLLKERATTHRFEGVDARPSTRMRLHNEIMLKLSRPAVIG